MKKLDLESIHDEVLDECFHNENHKVSSLIVSDDEEVEVTTTPTSEGYNTKERLPHGLTNEILIDRINAGTDVSRNMDMLVRCNSGLVYAIARKCTCNISFQDKVQYGFEGLIHAIRKFDTSKGVSFSTYASKAVRQTMYNYGNEEARIVALPKYQSVNNMTIQSFIERYISNNGKIPTNEQIAQGTNIDLTAVNRVMQYSSNAISLDTPVNDDGSVMLQDVIKGESSEFHLDPGLVTDESIMNELLEVIFQDLSQDDRALIEAVHGLNKDDEKSFWTLAAEGFVYTDSRGKQYSSRTSLHRCYNDVVAKIRRHMNARDIKSN